MSDRQQTVYRLEQQADGSRLARPRSEPIPEPSPLEVVIEIKAVSLNYRDIAMQVDSYPVEVKADVVPCSDACGRIAAVGSAVTDLSVGDTVVALFDPLAIYPGNRARSNAHGGSTDGFLRQYASVPASIVVKIPETADGEDHDYPALASLVCAGATAWNCLFGPVPIKPGQVVLVQGTGGVSISALTLAKAMGCTVIVTSSSDDKLKLAKEMGADHGINYRSTPDWAAEARKLTGEEGVDLVIDNCGSGEIERSLNAICRFGQVALVGFLSAADKMPDVAMGVLIKSAFVRGISTGTMLTLDDLVRFVTARKLKIRVDRVFPFDDTLKAFEYLKSGSHIGKVCIKM